MMVGVLCIVVSGGIFVSRNWQYIPDVLKKLTILAVAGGFFGGSYALEKKAKLRIAPVALYYLGVCFTGFSALGFITAEMMNSSARGILAMLFMSIPVVYRFIKRKGFGDFFVQLCLCEGMIFCMGNLSETIGYRATVLSVCTYLCLAAGFIYYCKRELANESNMIVVTIITYVIHVIYAVPAVIYGINCWKEFQFCMVPALLLAGSVSILYFTYEHKVLRVFQSMALLLCGTALSVFVFVRLLPDFTGHRGSFVFFASYLIGLGLMLALRREELFFINGALALVCTLVQIAEILLKESFLKVDVTCYPYAISMAVAAVVWFFLKEGYDDRIHFFKIVITYFMIGLHSLSCFFWTDYAFHYGVAFLFALAFLLFAFIIDHYLRDGEIPSAICKTFSLIFVIIALIANQIIPTTIYAQDGVTVLADFGFEYNMIFMGVGIVLLGKIWYSISRGIRLVQFIGTCILLGITLVHNMAVPALPNVMFLAVLTLVMLVVATILKDKKYAFASAVTLTLIILYLTKSFWMSIAWWVYLFVAGVALVIFAIKKEKAE